MIDSFREKPIRTLLHTAPGSIIGEVPRRTAVYALLGCIISELISTAVIDTFVAEGIPVGQHCISRTGSHAALSQIVCEVDSGVDHWTGRHTDADGGIIWMGEIIKRSLGRTKRHTGPGGIVSVHIYHI